MNALKRHGYWWGSFVFLFLTVPSITSGSIVKKRIGSLSAVRHHERKGRWYKLEETGVWDPGSRVSRDKTMRYIGESEAGVFLLGCTHAPVTGLLTRVFYRPEPFSFKYTQGPLLHGCLDPCSDATLQRWELPWLTITAAFFSSNLCPALYFLLAHKSTPKIMHLQVYLSSSFCPLRLSFH